MSGGRSARLALWLRLARRFMRTGPIRRSAAIVLVTTAVLMGLFVSLQGFSQSSEQVVEQDLGRFSAHLELGEGYGLDPGETGATHALVDAAERAGASRAMVLLQSFDVAPALTDAPRVTMFLEADWASRPFPDRYSLSDGRWPAAPGEVVVTPALAEATKGRRSVPILSGNERLRVVGRVRDRYATTSSKFLVAPGTWRAFDSSALARKYASLSASPTLLWSGGDGGRMVAALARVPRPGAGQFDLSGEPLSVRDQLSQNLRTRASELSKDRLTWLDRIPIAFLLPSIGLPLLAVIAGFAINTRRLRRNLGTLRAVGVGARDATAAVVLAGSAWFLAAAVAGVAIGAALGFPARLVGQWFESRPLSPYPDLSAPALRLVGVVFVSCLGVGIVMMLAQRRTTTRSLLSSLPRGRAASNIRHALATVAGAVAIWQVVNLDSVTEAMALVGTTAVVITLMTPEMVYTVLRRLPAAGPRRRLARQQLLFDHGRVLVCVALLTAALGPALGMVTLLNTLSASEAKNEVAEIAPGQVQLESSEGAFGTPQRELVQRVVTAVDPHAPPVDVSYVGSDDVRVNVEGDDVGFVIAVDSVEDAARLNNGTVTPEQRAALERGGLMAWKEIDDRNNRRLVLNDVTTDGPNSQTEPIPAAVGPFQDSWKSGVDGIILTSTARRLGLPFTRSVIVLTGVTRAGAAKAKQAALDAGYDARYVRIHRVPDAAEVPSAFWGAIAGLGVLVLLTVFTVSRAQATTLRGYLGGLIAIGLPPRWARNVLTLQTGVLVVISALLGFVIGLAPVVAAAVQVPGVSLAIPWLNLVGVVALFSAAAWLAIALSSSNLRASDRTGAAA